MNGLDTLIATPSGNAAVQAAAPKSGDAAPDDGNGDASRSFDALLAEVADPAVAHEAPAQPNAPGFATLPSVALRNSLQGTMQTMAQNMPAAELDASARADENTNAHEKAAAILDETMLSDLADGSDTSAIANASDGTPSQQAATSWSAAVSGAVALVMPMLTGAAGAAPARQPDVPARAGQPSASANGDATMNLSTDVGRLLDAAAGAAKGVLSDHAASPDSADFVFSANVTVLRTETHLPPVTPTTPLHQIVNAIATDLASAAAEPDPASAPGTAATSTPERQLVRMLDIRLEPPDLGAVTVKLRLSGQHLALRISADTANTAQSLDQDRDTLATLLRGNGYTPEISAVRHEPAPAAAVPVTSGTDAAASSQGAANQAGGQGLADGGARPHSGQPGNQQQARPASELPEGHDADVQDTASRSGVYL